MTNHEEQKSLDLAALRQRLAGKKGKEYWRSLNELADTDGFEEMVKHEFPRQANLLDSMTRRDFLKLLGASLAMTGLAACTPQSPDKILPYTKPPEELVPGKPMYFASSMVQDGYAKGVLVTTTMGRPIKVDGLPEHPATLGGSDVFIQASILELYDPDRVKEISSKGAAKSWQDFTSALSGLAQGNIRILTGSVTSPTLADQMKALLAKFPQAKWVQFSPVNRRNSQAATNAAYGGFFDPVYDFNKADVILSLDSDFLLNEPGHVRYGHDFGLRHQPISTNGTMNRLYVVESSSTITGANADHRLPVKPSQVESFARALAGKLGISGGTPSGTVPGQSWLDPLAADLQKAGKAALVIAGERQPAAVHALALAMNEALGSMGNTVTLIPAVDANPSDPYAALKSLTDELNAGSVDLLVVLENNPVYTAPADLKFADAFKKAKNSVYLAFYPDETAKLATWVVPAAHYLEMWGDARAYDGSTSLIQPVIEPLYSGKSPYELVAALLGQNNAKGYNLVKGFWTKQPGGSDRTWRAALSKGLVPTSGEPTAGPSGKVNSAALSTAAPAAPSGMEIVFEPDFTVWDGRFTNNSWLQELPKPLTKLTWDNAAFVAPATATKLGAADEELLSLKLRGRSIQAPLFVDPGLPEDVVVVSLGYGRTAGGEVLTGTGYNAYALQTSEAPWFDTGLQVSKTGGTYSLAPTRDHWSMENRELVRSASLDEYQKNPNFAHEGTQESPPTLYTPYEYPGYAWGMSINLNTCIGCNACVIACQAENNIPTVGKDQVQRSREMHWLRIDRYYSGSIDHPTTFFEPVPCMHCETAPCEPVCPVEATSHSAEGINEMTYNRCVGTRYCSNNCPYKVRRFNFYKYVNENILPLRAQRNPDVTVRMRGVMEKCTYCVQRVNNARIQAEIENRPIRDGEVKTACQVACPTNAIVFGNINDTGSEVRKLKDTPLNYALLEDLGTKPRTTYLAKVRNPNPLIKETA